MFGNTNAIQTTGNGHATSPTQPSSSAPPPSVAAVATTVVTAGGGSGHSSPAPFWRAQPAKLEGALEAAYKRVLAADKLVSTASSEDDFHDATSTLETAVINLEKVSACARRCQAIAKDLAADEDREERERKRARMSSPQLHTSNMALNEATGAASEAVDGGDIDRDGQDNVPVE